MDTDNLTWMTPTLDLPGMTIPRRYHSVAILLPNAKVLLGGGRVENGGDTEDDTERRLSIFEPGYLNDGPQPIIVDAPDSITYGNTFTITVDDTYLLDSIVLIKLGSVTHGNNMEQRYVELNYVSSDGEPYHVATAPSDAYKAPPGYYMLFVLKHLSESNSGYSKIPSNAKIVKIS